MTNSYQRLYTQGLLVLAGLMPVYIIRCSLFGIPANLFEVGVVIVLIMGIFSGAVRTSWAKTIKESSRMQIVAIVLFLLSACLATAISHELRVSLGIMKSWIGIPLVFGFLVASASKNNPEIKKRILDSLICSGVIVACIGIGQIGMLARIRSLYDVPNSLALFLVPVGIIALYRGVQLHSKTYLISAGVMGGAILATQSFGAMTAIMGTFIIAYAVKALPPRGEKGRYIAKSVGSIILLSLLVFTLSSRFLYIVSPFFHSHATNSATVRIQLWDIGIRLIQQHPLLGIGLGQFEPAYQAVLHQRFAAHNDLPPEAQATHRAPQPEYVFRDSHNWIISFWLNTGVLGLVSFAYLNFTAIRTAMKGKNNEDRAIGLALIAMLLFGLVDTIYWKNDLSALWWMLVICLL